MADDGNQKMRPRPKIPPIPLPLPLPTPIPVVSNEQPMSNLGRFQPGDCKLTLPSEREGASLSRSQAETSGQHAGLPSESPQRADFEPTPASQPSTVRSKQSGHSRQNASGHVHFEPTRRGQMEALTEQALFKRTGQLPPTPTEGTINEDDVYIRTDDLREQCRAVSEERKQKDRDEPKSPKKSLFGNIKSAFTRTPNNASAPSMLPKAAEVFGMTPRRVRKIEVRPIKPSGYIPSPTRVPRSDTSKSLPEKIANIGSYARRHHGSPRDSRESHQSRSRRRRLRSSSGSSKYSSGAEDMPLVPQSKTSFEGTAPPTPPEKDRPYTHWPAQAPPSPLRRAPPSEHLRETYGAGIDRGMELRFPGFALTPSPSNAAIAGNARASPADNQQYTSGDYVKLLTGEPLQWPHRTDSISHYENNPHHYNHPFHYNNPYAPSASDSRKGMYFPPSLGPDSDNGPTLAPRFYIPGNLFADGEALHENTDPNRLLFSVPPQTNPHYVHEQSSKGSIDMVYRGPAADIDTHSSTGGLNDSSQDTAASQSRHNMEQATHAMQELHVGGLHDFTPQETGASSRPPRDQSSFRLTDLLSGVSPRKNGFNEHFQPNCPSAVPSPLHQMSRPQGPSQPAAPSPAALINKPRSLEAHFLMTNEHLDVVGKSIYDVLESNRQQQSASQNTKHGQLVALFKKHEEELKSQASILNEKADRAAEKHNNVHNDVEAMLTYMEDIKDEMKEDLKEGIKEGIKEGMTDAQAAQDKKMAEMNTNLKQLQTSVQGLQQLLEQTLSGLKTSGAAPTPNAFNANPSLPIPRSQPPLAGYSSHPNEMGRENAAATQPQYENRGVAPGYDNQHDQRTGYNTGFGQQYGPRQGYPSRNSREERPPYVATNPYHYPNNGQYNNGYVSAYSNYNHPPNAHDQAHPYGHGSTK